MSYIFNTTPNSYFRGQDLRVEDTNTHEVITINRKEGHNWAVNVKHDFVYRSAPANVRAAIDALGDVKCENIEQSVQRAFWTEADALANEHGWADIHSAGRSSGWLVLPRTWESPSPIEPVEDERDDVARWLRFCFAVTRLVEEAETRFQAELELAAQQLQIELSEYADWIGGEIRTLDGNNMPALKLSVRNGRACIEGDPDAGDGFSFATDSTLLRRKDGAQPARLEADAVMEEILQIIEARGNLSKQEIDNWLDTDDDHNPLVLYQDIVAPAVNEIEDKMLERIAHRD